jgi:multidrug efflux pump
LLFVKPAIHNDGLFVATFLTLLYLPGLHALWFRKSLEETGRREHVGLTPQHQG